MRRHCPMAARACTFGSCLGRLPISIRRRPTPIAPEETMTTLCPFLRRLTAVSTIRERMERRGSCVFSSTMEEVPLRMLEKHHSSIGFDLPSLMTIVRCFFMILIYVYDL